MKASLKGGVEFGCPPGMDDRPGPVFTFAGDLGEYKFLAGVGEIDVNRGHKFLPASVRRGPAGRT